MFPWARMDGRFAGFCLAVMVLPVMAGEFSVTVTTADGKPLPDAVVWVSPGAAPLSPAPSVMDQLDKRFKPFVLPVQTGTQVDFPNSDSINHHVYSFSPAKRFELKLFPGSHNAHTVTFDKPGLVTLGCNIHDWMLAYILVLPTSSFGKTNAQGELKLPVPDGMVKEISVWHPQLASAPEPLVQKVSGVHMQIRLDKPLKPDPRRRPRGYD
ncbi:MAG: methylamine utilization protein [Fluviicoccus sp.]|uniref:methylamine utilization protein n=1 Tax=Fluviicoccus sp. TaxID=2003552 RepID=UPI00272299B8|nr:methylamine utilization protein [Fluviicoccus sp.]MDO8329953.1 methylamine utilization protein [Fluviicoccus sp.]